jgi:hypothetical protein
LQRALPILFGAGFTVAVSIAAGMLLLRRLLIVLDRVEEVLFAFVAGSACVSSLVFLLCVVHQARLPVFLIGGAALIGGAILTPGQPHLRLKPFPMDIYLYGLLFSVCFFVYFFHSLAPEVSPDGSGYHLGNVVRFAHARGFVWDYHSMYSYLSQGLEMLFLVAYTFGGMPSAAIVHLTFLCVLALLVACYGRRFGFVRAGMFAGLLVFATPVVGLVGVSAYNDVALATCIYAVFYLLQVWNEDQSNNLLIVLGLLVGFCYAIKYTGWITFPFVVIALRGQGLGRVIPSAALTAAPWMLRNWLWVKNPFAPFLNSWFPNPFYSAEMEVAYLHDLRHIEGFRHWWEIPLDLTIYGAKLPGFLGPVFLLTPFAFLALRYPHGRRVLTAAAVFSVPVFLNPAARFLIPALPFLALAMGLAMQNSPGVLPAVAAFHTMLSLPSVMPTYCADWAWRIRGVPVAVALGRAPEAPYIQQFVPDYWLKEAVEQNVPKGQILFSFATRPEAYINRRIVVAYESTEGDRAQQILAQHRPASELKAMGIDFVLINESDFLGPDIQKNANSLGLNLIEQRNGTSLYGIG